MSEPLSAYNIASTDVLNQNLCYDTTGSSSILVSGLAPVSEETRLRLLHNSRLNMDMQPPFTHSEDSMVYVSTGSDKFCAHERQKCIPQYSIDNRVHSFLQQESSHNTASNLGSMSSNTSMGCGNPTSEIQYNTSAKTVRKFHFMNAFIPSFVFVVFIMMISAVIVLEFDLDLFVHIRNLPEMISLRYQYYEPMKAYLLQKVGRKI